MASPSPFRRPGSSVACSVLLVLGLVACGDDDMGGADAATDATLDTGTDVGPDAPSCPMSCSGTESCCPAEDGTLRCIDIREDDLNCGGCAIECDPGRGTHCDRGSCVCGSNERGCEGDTGNFCCPPSGDRTQHYCANLERDGSDCGECGRGCDVTRGNTCVGGRCFCGERTETCEGTRASTCCDSPFGAECVDLDVEREHCGACGRRCAFGERCRDGECFDPMAPDAGPPDAGAPDAGPADAGSDAASDAGSDDAGTDAAVMGGS